MPLRARFKGQRKHTEEDGQQVGGMTYGELGHPGDLDRHGAVHDRVGERGVVVDEKIDKGAAVLDREHPCVQRAEIVVRRPRGRLATGDPHVAPPWVRGDVGLVSELLEGAAVAVGLIATKEK